MYKKSNLLVWLPSFLLIQYVISIFPAEYIYPLTKYLDNGQEIVLCMHQAANQATRLWSLNLETNNYEQLLSSQYNPTGVTLLPDNSGFSFLDNGIIKVKNFLKRSAKIIELYEPLYNIGMVQWISNSTCFFHAKEGNRYGIYQANLDGEVDTVIKSALCDYLYPQKVNDMLFCIERDLNGSHSIKKAAYSNQSQDCIPIEVYSFEKKIIINLTMINECDGYVIEHVSIDSKDILVGFNFYKLTCCEEGTWEAIKLFTFYIPVNMLCDPTTMLCEFVAPLFPVVTPDMIYFVSAESHDYQSLYRYNQHSGLIVPCQTNYFFPISEMGVFPSILSNYRKRLNTLNVIMTKHGLLSGFSLA